MRDDELDLESVELLPELNGHETEYEDDEEFDDGLLSSETDVELDEGRKRSRRLARRRPLPSRFPGRPRRPSPPGSLRPGFRRRMVDQDAAPCTCSKKETEYTRWVQSSLNQILGQNLLVTGIMNPATRNALRQFQQQQNLRTDGIAGPGTKQALLYALGDGIQDDVSSTVKSTDANEIDGLDLDLQEFEGTALDEEQFLGSLWPFSSTPSLVDRTAHSPKDKRKKVRNINDVHALVLHQAGFSRGNDHHKYDKVTAHFVILPNGTILHLHPLTAYLYASNGFNKFSVAVEFVGNFPSTQGKCYKPERFGCNEVTDAQIKAGRELIRYLIKTIGLTHILAHRQSSGSRGNDPGPDIWYRVGQWAVSELGLKDGGPGYKVQSGQSIPDSWRSWKT